MKPTRFLKSSAQPAPTVKTLRRGGGFTLIELLIVVAMIGIITMIALPSYQDYILRSRLPEAFSALTDLSVKMEQYYQDHRRYATAVNGTDCDSNLLNSVKSDYFNVTCTVNTPGTGAPYLLTATGKASAVTSGFVYTLSGAGKRATSIAATSRWGAITKTETDNCWVANKNQQCYK